MYSTRWKSIALISQIIFFEFTYGITTGVIEKPRSKIKFENGSVYDNYHMRGSQYNFQNGVSPLNLVISDPIHSSPSSQVNPVFSPSPSQPDSAYSPTIPIPKPHLKKGKADKRSGISVEKTPPDLQFGLAFTVPFISLSTDRLLSTVSGHRGYNSLSDIMSILKLNVGGLVLAAVVGIAAALFVPAIFAGKGQGFGGGLANLFQGNFMPGLLEHIMPGLGLNKPIGFGQYDNTIYNDPYGNNLPYGINRKDPDGRSRAINENGTSSVFADVTHFLGNYIGQAQSCALYTMCKRGQDEKKGTSGGGRGGRKETTKLTTLDHAIEVIQAVSDDIPGLEKFKAAYTFGQKEEMDCSTKFKDCDVGSTTQIKDYINNIGEFIFS